MGPAAEAHLLNFASAAYILGQMPSLLNHVQRHLAANDSRRQEFERVAKKVGVKDSDHPTKADDEQLADKIKKVEEERGGIVSTVRGASSAAVREQLRVASFRNVLVVTTILMAVLAVGVAVIGFDAPPQTGSPILTGQGTPARLHKGSP